MRGREMNSPVESPRGNEDAERQTSEVVARQEAFGRQVAVRIELGAFCSHLKPPCHFAKGSAAGLPDPDGVCASCIRRCRQ